MSECSHSSAHVVVNSQPSDLVGHPFGRGMPSSSSVELRLKFSPSICSLQILISPVAGVLAGIPCATCCATKDDKEHEPCQHGGRQKTKYSPKFHRTSFTDILQFSRFTTLVTSARKIVAHVEFKIRVVWIRVEDHIMKANSPKN